IPSANLPVRLSQPTCPAAHTTGPELTASAQALSAPMASSRSGFTSNWRRTTSVIQPPSRSSARDRDRRPHVSYTGSAYRQAVSSHRLAGQVCAHLNHDRSPMTTPRNVPSVNRRFEGQTVIVTGAGSGLGRATSLRFAAEGASVAVLDIVEEAATETAALI